VDKGTATMGGLEVASPEHAATENLPAIGYVRSHDIEIERERRDPGAMAAEVRYLLSVGPLVRVNLILSGTRDPVEVDLARDVAERLNLQVGETVFARARKVRLFVEDYQI
jgi:sulfate/thiosulfate transport system ATP-binding protein